MCETGASRVTVRVVREWEKAAPTWRTLASESPYTSFFLSTAWVDSWMEVFGPTLETEFLVFEAGTGTVAVCLLVARTVWNGPFRVRRIYLNTSGEREGSPMMEYNNLLCREGWEKKVADALVLHVRSRAWDELVLDGFCEGQPLQALEAALAALDEEVTWHPVRYVDLQVLRDSGQDYDAALSRKWRQNLRQSNRRYEISGPLKIDSASDTAEALAMFDRLTEYHQLTWSRRGQSGGFAAAASTAFHRALIRRAHPLGQVDLFRVSAGSECVGYRYTFVAQEKVYCYQSGLNYHPGDGHFRPGLTLNALAIRHYRDRGLREYDFMAVDAEYKRALGTHSRRLGWISFRRGFKMRLWKLARALKRRLTAKYRMLRQRASRGLGIHELPEKDLQRDGGPQ
jgi:CelD/BcsL family acetyltransferase involved in cellulose biosynthesis